MSDKGCIAVSGDLAASELGDNGRAALAEVCRLPVEKQGRAREALAATNRKLRAGSEDAGRPSLVIPVI